MSQYYATCSGWTGAAPLSKIEYMQDKTDRWTWGRCFIVMLEAASMITKAIVSTQMSKCVSVGTRYVRGAAENVPSVLSPRYR